MRRLVFAVAAVAAFAQAARATVTTSGMSFSKKFNGLRSVVGRVPLTLVTLLAGSAAFVPAEATAAIVWSTASGGAVDSSPAVVNGLVYVGSTDGFLYALDAATGKTVWKTLTGGAVDSSPAVVNGIVYVGSTDGFLYALDAATGKVLWKTLTGGAVASSPAVVNGVVYVGSGDGFLYALDAATGKVLSKTHTGGAIDSSPAVVNGVVYVGSNDFSVYAIDAISVPEPPSLALLAFGLVWVGLLLTRRRKGAPKNSHDPLHAAVERLTGPSSLLVQLIKP